MAATKIRTMFPESKSSTTVAQPTRDSAISETDAMPNGDPASTRSIPSDNPFTSAGWELFHSPAEQDNKATPYSRFPPHSNSVAMIPVQAEGGHVCADIKVGSSYVVSTFSDSSECEEASIHSDMTNSSECSDWGSPPEEESSGARPPNP